MKVLKSFVNINICPMFGKEFRFSWPIGGCSILLTLTAYIYKYEVLPEAILKNPSPQNEIFIVTDSKNNDRLDSLILEWQKKNRAQAVKLKK